MKINGKTEPLRNGQSLPYQPTGLYNELFKELEEVVGDGSKNDLMVVPPSLIRWDTNLDNCSRTRRLVCSVDRHCS